MQNFLVFEGIEVDAAAVYRGAVAPEDRRKTVTFGNAEPLLIAAANEQAAGMAAMRKTRRISQYAIIPCTLIDFAAEIDEEPKATPVALTATAVQESDSEVHPE